MTTSDPRAPRDQESWARPVDRLTTTATGAGSATVPGQRVAGPAQGIGPKWQKTCAIRSSESFVSLLMAKYALAGSSAAPPRLVNSLRVNSSSGVFAATALRIHSRKA